MIDGWRRALPPRRVLPAVGPLGLLAVSPGSSAWALLFLGGFVLSEVFSRELMPVMRRPAVRRAQNTSLLAILLLLAIFAPAPVLEWFLRFAVLIGLTLALALSEPQREWKLFVVTFLLILISAAQTEAPVIALPLGAFVALLPVALADLERSRLPPELQEASPRAWRDGFFLALLCLALFFAIPRSSRAMAGRGLLQPQELGLGDSITLNSITDLKLSPRVAMRVKVDAPLPPGIKWRGSAFDRYDGRTWRISTPKTGLLRRRVDDSGRFHIADVASDGPLLRQDFVVEPGIATVLFAARRVATLESTAFEQVLLRDEDLVLGSPPQGPLRYTAVSVPPDWAYQKRDRNAPVDHHRYLELPDVDAAVPRLAREVTRGAQGAREQLDAIERFFLSEFRYSLAVTRPGNRQPLDDFLLETRVGHCEFFASGMVVLARSLGIPARLVDGFAEGEFSDLAQSYVVRRSDAHAWVEAFVEGEGWLEFDPTPAGEPSSGVVAMLASLRQRIVNLWSHLIADYSSTEQRAIGARVLVAVRTVAAPLPAALALAIASAALIWRYQRRSRGVGGIRRRGTPASGVLRRARHLLRDLGIPHGPADTAQETLARSMGVAELPALAEIVALHEAAVYAPGGVLDVARAAGSLRRLRREVREARRGLQGSAPGFRERLRFRAR